MSSDETSLGWWQRQMRHLLWTPRQAVAIGLAGVLLILAVVLIVAAA